MNPPPSSGPKITCLGQVVIALFILACVGGAGWMFLRQPISGLFSGGPGPVSPQPGPDPVASVPSGAVTEIGIAYGTEKKKWLEWATGEFAKSPEGRGVKVNLIPMGSLEGAQAIIKGDTRINVWSPASALYRANFLQDWEGAYQTGKSPIVREEPLALTPMVFVFWKERYPLFVQKYGIPTTFGHIRSALAEPAGWMGIANKPEWGVFKFGHTHPGESNSGLMALVLMAYDHHKKTRGLTQADILNPGFQANMKAIESAVSGMTNSTGKMMNEMVLKGPSTYDCLLVYESVAIESFANANGRWGELQVTYPEYNAWNDNPYCILDTPWTTAAQRQAAGVFLDFLLSDPIQAKCLEHGFRPANTAIPIIGPKCPDSPFEKLKDAGFQVKIDKVCEPPSADVIFNLNLIWQRNK